MKDGIQFSVRQGGERMGPFPLEQIRAMHEQQAFAADAEVAPRGTDNWTPVDSFLLAAAAAEKAAANPINCTACGAKNARPVELAQVTSFLVLTTWRKFDQPLCRPCIARQGRKRMLISALLGWWGVPWGIIRTPWALWVNQRALSRAGFGGVGTALFTMALTVPILSVAGVTYMEQRERATARESGMERVRDDVVVCLDASRQALDAGNAAGAVQQAQAAVRADATSWIAHATLARAQISAGQVPAAITELNAAIQLNPDFPGLREDLAYAMFAAGQLDQADRVVEAALKRWPSDPGVNTVRFACNAMRRRFDQCLVNPQFVTVDDEQECGVATFVALALAEDGKAREGADLLEILAGQATTAFATDLQVWRVRLLCGLSDFAKIEKILRYVDPKRSSVREVRGSVQLHRGNYVQAVEILQDLVDDRSAALDDRILASFELGIALLRNGKRDAAVAAWEACPRPQKDPELNFPSVASNFLATGEGLPQPDPTARPGTVENRHANDLAFVKAMYHEISGEKADAIKGYRQCVAMSPGKTYPYQFAKAALERLGER